MNKLKQNLFWVGVAVGLAVVGAVAGLWWYPLHDSAGTEKSAIAGLNGELQGLITQAPWEKAAPDIKSGAPGQKDIDKWQDLKKQFQGDFKKIAENYISHDAQLEEWFKSLTNKTNPPHGEFCNSLVDAAKALEEEIRKKGVLIGLPNESKPDGKYGFNWGDVVNLPWTAITDDERKSAIRDLQKRYWVCELIRDAVIAEGVKAERLNDVFFFKPLADPTKLPVEARPTAQEGEIKYVGSPAAEFGATKYEELYLPEGEKPAKPEDPKNYLGRTITFGFSVTLSYSDVAKLIREVITPSKSQLLVNVTGVRIFAPTQNPLKKDDQIKIPKGEPKDEKIAARKKELEAAVKPHPVQVWITGQVIDFDPSKVPAWGK